MNDVLDDIVYKSADCSGLLCTVELAEFIRHIHVHAPTRQREGGRFAPRYGSR